jgi:hypothetical protein
MNKKKQTRKKFYSQKFKIFLIINLKKSYLKKLTKHSQNLFCF